MRTFLMCYEALHKSVTGSVHGHSFVTMERLDEQSITEVADKILKNLKSAYPSTRFATLIWRSITPLDP